MVSSRHLSKAMSSPAVTTLTLIILVPIASELPVPEVVSRRTSRLDIHMDSLQPTISLDLVEVTHPAMRSSRATSRLPQSRTRPPTASNVWWPPPRPRPVPCRRWLNESYATRRQRDLFKFAVVRCVEELGRRYRPQAIESIRPDRIAAACAENVPIHPAGSFATTNSDAPGPFANQRSVSMA